MIIALEVIGAVVVIAIVFVIVMAVFFTDYSK
jgi:hypothetical protein